MMGGHGGSDPRIAAIGDVVAVLRLLADPDGLKQLADDLDARQKAALAALSDAYAKGEALAQEIAETKDALAARESSVTAAEAVLAPRDRAIMAAASENDRTRAHLADTAAHLKADQDALVVAQADLAEQKKASAAIHERLAQDLETAHATRMAQADSDIGARETAARQMAGRAADADRAATQRHAALDQREDLLDERDEALAVKEKAVETLHQDLSARLAQLRAITGA